MNSVTSLTVHIGGILEDEITLQDPQGWTVATMNWPYLEEAKVIAQAIADCFNARMQAAAAANRPSGKIIHARAASPQELLESIWVDLIQHGIPRPTASRARSVIQALQDDGVPAVDLLNAKPDVFRVRRNCGRQTLHAIGEWLRRHGFAAGLEWTLLLGS